jgi:hypothetical protein
MQNRANIISRHQAGSFKRAANNDQMKPELETAPHDQRSVTRSDPSPKQAKQHQHHHRKPKQCTVLHYTIQQEECQEAKNTTGKNRRTSQAHGATSKWGGLCRAVLCCVPNKMLARSISKGGLCAFPRHVVQRYLHRGPRHCFQICFQR